MKSQNKRLFRWLMLLLVLSVFRMAQASKGDGSLTEFINTCSGKIPGSGMTRYTAQPRQNPCENKGTSLVYKIQEGALFVCESSENKGGYVMATGSRGFGKTQQGDRKTPVGKYALGEPRASAEFGIFIPVAYPNASDLKKGFTGGDIGIHGPKRFLVCGGAINLMVDWTAGCLAVASDNQILELAEWVQKNPAATLTIE